MKTIGRGSLASLLTGMLNVAWYGVALGLALALVVLIVVPFVDLPGMKVMIPVSFTLDAQTHRVTAPTLGIDGTVPEVGVGGSPGFGFDFGDPVSKQARVHVRGSLQFPTRSRPFLAASAAILIAMLGLLLFGLGQLRAVFRTLGDGHPFVAANAARFRWVGIAIIASELARAAIVFFENSYALTHFTAEGLRFDAWPDLNFFAIVHGLVVLVIAEVFRLGTRLDEDQSLTV